MARPETDLPLPFCPKEAAALWDFVYLYGELPSMSDTEYIPAVGPGTENPWSMSWAKVQQLWNKPALLTFAGSMDVREYDLDAEEVIDRTITFDTAAYEATLSTTPIKRFIGSKYIHESGLVCPTSYFFMLANSSGVEDSEDNISVRLDWWVPVAGTEDNEVAQLHKFDGDFYPQFKVLFEVLTKNGGFYIAKTVITPDEIDLGIYTTHTDKLVSFSDNITTFARDFGPGVGEEGLVNYNLEVSAFKWFPYKDAAGTPLYDEDTGEPV